MAFTLLKNKAHDFISDKRFSEILTGSAWALSARVIATGLGLITSIIIARLYGAEVMGIVALIQSFLLMTTIVTVFGTNNSLLRLIPEHLVRYSPTSAFRVYRKTQLLVISVSLLTGCLFFLCSDFIADRVFSKPHLSFYLALASVFVVFKSLALLNTQAVRGLRLIKAFAFMQIIPSGVTLFLLIFLNLVWSDKGIPVYAVLGGFAMAGIVGWMIMEYSFRKKIQSDDFIQSMSCKKIVSVSLPMFMTATMTFVISETGVIMLGMFRSEAEVGYYSIAVRLATLTAFVLGAINSMAAPKFSELYYSNKLDELFYVAKKSTKLIFWSTTPILVGFVLFGKLFLNIVYGPDFTVAYPALLIVVLGQFVNSISGSTGIFMNMTGKESVFRNIVFVAALTNIILNFLLVPKMGINGAALSAMVSLMIWNLSTLCYIKRKFGQTIGYFPTFKKTQF